MKVLPQTARETKQDFYGKKGWSLHFVLVYVKSNNSQICIEAFDHWTCDAKQDAWFTASSLHGVIEALDKKPEWISIISDNGSHYHNSELMIILSYWKEWYNIKVNKWISQSIRRRVKLGFEIRNGENIQERWPDEEGLDGCIQARALPHIGEWKTFTPNQIFNWMKDEVHMSQPQISLHMTSKSSWKILITHSSSVSIKWLKVKQLQEELGNWGIMVNEKENQTEMIEILENEMAFPLLCDWALKHNQKYGKKGLGKRIAPQVIALLERFFLDGNVHKNRRMNGNNMQDKLVKKQESGKLAHDIKIPEVSSINNWIAEIDINITFKLALTIVHEGLGIKLTDDWLIIVAIDEFNKILTHFENDTGRRFLSKLSQILGSVMCNPPEHTTVEYINNGDLIKNWLYEDKIMPAVKQYANGHYLASVWPFAIKLIEDTILQTPVYREEIIDLTIDVKKIRKALKNDLSRYNNRWFLAVYTTQITDFQIEDPRCIILHSIGMKRHLKSTMIKRAFHLLEHQKVNANIFDVFELQQTNSIREKYASHIVKERENGPYENWKDLKSHVSKLLKILEDRFEY
ncbi:hypothetical protein RclHR1_04530015 [Rhizophagus clarus]|uniref:Uncharacterized protein n=1 Tax=Rhizophagus clarus TaxID=94130 RepID=A0A2Z6RMY0_9GLOM|nr:hypothetical protein RclHR1_04530015 [Rhizophagus clarus]